MYYKWIFSYIYKMKKILLFLFCFPLLVMAQQTYVPDDNFEQELINQGFDNVLDDYVTTSNINAIGGLYVSNQNISDLTGIEDFIALVSLECNDNQLTTLDLSNNTALSYLECWGNQLTSLDLTQNLMLDYLYCMDNQLTSIDLTANTALIVLRLDYNQLTSLDLTNNINLEYLDFYESQLTTIDLSQNTNLVELRCGFNQLTNLDLSQNTNLEILICPNNLLTSIDLTQCINLELLVSPENQLTSLDLTNNINLKDLHTEDNYLTDIDLSNNPNLINLRIDNNLLYLLDLAYQDIEYINCSNNQITDLIIDSDSLNELFCGNNPISSFDATQHINLEMLEIFNTYLFNIDLSQNQYLWFLSIGSNPGLWSLDLSNNYNLEHLDLYSNSLSVLDMRNGNNHNMTYFVTWNCWNSQFLECISVDDSTYSTNNWTSIDTWHYFNNNCNPLEIEEHSSKKELLKITDLLGREIKGAKNQLLFYIYDDGTVEKKLVIE
jgi:hypothetical protein